MELSFIALDLETTGLSDTAEIIEIGLCRVIDGQITEYFSSFVHPTHIIPTDITLLTGIDNQMVKDAPSWQEIETEIKNFIGDATLVAHNISFDRTILENHLGYTTQNQWIDTHDLAKIFLPNLTSYKLIALLQALNIEQSQHHRALADAEGCALVLLDILKIAEETNPFTLQKISDIFSDDNCGLSTLLAKLCGASSAKTSFDYHLSSENFPPVEDTAKPALSFHQAEKFFSADGVMNQAHSDFQYRPQQIDMLHTISDAFLYQKHAIIEAGTGTGKSFAYLVPALLWAYENQTRVIISTNTIALQEQLFHKDVPFLSDCLGYPFKATLSKGRTNYLCLRRLDLYRSQKTNMIWSEKLFLAQITYWTSFLTDGDKESLNLNKLEHQLWNNISSQGETCLGNRCPYYKRCYFLNNRRKCEQSHLIITNHALLLQDLKLEGAILPQYNQLIIDEAHHLEDEAIKQFTSTIDLELLKKTAKQLTRSGGIVARIMHKIYDNPAFNETYSLLEETQKLLNDDISLLEQSITTCIENIFSIKALEKSNEKRITKKERSTDWWQAFAQELQNMSQYLSSLAHHMAKISNALEMSESIEDLTKELSFNLCWFNDQKALTEEFLQGESAEKVYWIEYFKTGWGHNLCLSLATINIMPILKEKLFESKESVILTSATLAIRNDLTYTAQSFLLEEDEYISYITPSPFDYKKQSLIAIPIDNPDYSQTNEYAYTEMVIRNLEKIIPSVCGGILVLFTSYAMLNKVYFALKRNPALSEYNILAHGQDGSRSSILHNLNHVEKTIVLGASSFWEGIDVKGSGLTTVVIVKLPFAPPTKPLDSAKLELLQAQGKNGFMDYSLPQAILKFRQGCGRLIRTDSDWGAVIILDNRVLTKNYGHDFLLSLPQQTIVRDELDVICRKISKWMHKMASQES